MRKIFVILFGIIFAGIGIFLLINGNELKKRCTAETVGTVVEIVREESTDSDGDMEYTYYPIIEYKAGDSVINRKSSAGSSSSKYNVNDKVDILYNPNKAEEFIIKGDNSSNILGIIFIVVGIIVAIFGVIGRI